MILFLQTRQIMVYCYLFNPTIRFMEHFFMKKKLTVLCILIAAVLVVSACTGMVSTALTANWHTSDIDYDPAFYEELTYDVAYNGDEATTTVYDMKDFKGTYVMKISAGEIYPTADGKTINELYKMETDLSLSGTFAQKGGKDVFAFSDLSVVSTVYFHRIGEGYNLQPVHSETKYLVYAPGQGSLNAVDIRIAKYDVVIDYNDSCSAAKYSKKDRSGELDVSIPDEWKNNVRIEKANDVENQSFSKLQNSYSFFDNAQLYFAARGMAFAQNSSFTVNTIVPNANKTAKLQFSCSSVSSRKYAFTMDGKEVNEDISSAEVSMGLSEGNSSGSSVKLYLATKAEGLSNTYRNLPLQIEEPYSFGLGKMVYSLKNVSTVRPA